MGKSTIIRRYLAQNPCRVGGFCTVAGPYAQDGSSDVHILPADGSGVPGAENTVFHRFGLHAKKGLAVYTQVYEGQGPALLGPGSDGADIIIMDELGPKEEQALAFQQAVLDRIGGPVPVLGVVMRRKSAFLDRVRSHPNVRLITVTEENRERVLAGLPPLAQWERGWQGEA